MLLNSVGLFGVMPPVLGLFSSVSSFFFGPEFLRTIAGFVSSLLLAIIDAILLTPTV